MTQTQPTPKPARSLRLWWILLTVAVAGVPILLIAMIVEYLSSQTARFERRDRALAAERQVEEFSARQAATLTQNAIPAPPPMVPMGQTSTSITPVQVEFVDFGSRTADALIVDVADGLAYLTAPSPLFNPISGKLNGRMVTQQPAQISLPETAAGMALPPGTMGIPGMGVLPVTPAVSVVVAGPLPGLGLTLLRTQTRLTPLRIKGDFAKAEVGETLSVHQTLMSNPSPQTLTVLATDEAVTDVAGQRLEHVLKLTACQDGLGSLIYNSKGEPIGQIVLTTSAKSGSSFTYAAPLGRIFDEYYSHTSDSAKGSQDQSGAMVDVLRSGLTPSHADESFPLPRADLATADSGGRPKPEAQADSERTPPVQPSPVATASPDNAPVDALLPDAAAKTPELRIYKVRSFAPTAADQLRPLFSDTVQIAADKANGTVLVIGDKSTHEKVAVALKAIDEVALLKFNEPTASAAQPKSDAISIADPHALPGLSADPVRGISDDKQPPEITLSSQDVKRTGPGPQEIAQLITRLYGRQTTISVDDASGRVLVTINPAVTSAEAQQVLAEIKSTAADLAYPATSSQRTVTIYGTGSNGLTGRITLDADQQSVSLTRRDDTSMDRLARQLAQKYLSANAAEQPALREELTDLTERHFNLRQAERQRDIDEISMRLEKLRASHQQRQQHKSEVIERRIQDLLDTNSDFWTGESHNAKRSTAPAQAAIDAGARPKPATVSPASNGPQENPLPGRDTVTTAGTATGAERTFDGVPYAQWVQMLETERKASKLAMAIDACSRLVKPEDQIRIAHLIIAAAQSFEAGDYAEWTKVWETSWEGLGRLRPDVVASELLAAIRAPESTPDARRYQGRTLAEKLSAKTRESMLQQSPKIIDELVQLQQNGGPGVDWLLAGASVLWRDLGRPLDDYPNLRMQMIQMIDEGFGSAGPGQIQPIRHEWQIVAETLIAKAPTTPDLALKLMKHAGKNVYVIRMIGELGRHAEPVVPLLVEHFVANWNAYERASRLAEPDISFTRAAPEVPERCRDVIAALGKIGVGEKGAILLRDLRLILPASRTRFSLPREMRLSPLAEIVDAALPHWVLPSNDAMPLILNDNTMITGTWHLSAGLPSASNLMLRFDPQTVQVPRSVGKGLFLTEEGQKLGDRFEIDPSAAVKQISFFDVTGPRGANQKELPGTRRDGIYELTGTKLRFQLANPGQPRPTAFVKDRADLAPGEVLLEFEREILDGATGTQTLR